MIQANNEDWKPSETEVNAGSVRVVFASACACVFVCKLYRCPDYAMTRISSANLRFVPIIVLCVVLLVYKALCPARHFW